MGLRRKRFTMGQMMIAVAIAGVLFAALQYDVGRRGYLLFLLAFALFASSAAVASRSGGRARAAALALALVGCVIGWSVFAIFGTR